MEKKMTFIVGNNDPYINTSTIEALPVDLTPPQTLVYCESSHEYVLGNSGWKCRFCNHPLEEKKKK